MMQVAFQSNPGEFLGRCGPLLEKNPAEHNLILSLCQTADLRMKRGEKTDIRLTTVFSDDDFVIAAVQTPPSNLVLSRAGAHQPEIEKLAETLANQNAEFPGIIGPSDVASAFATAWTGLTGKKFVEYMDQIVYALTKVVFPPPIPGEFRLARPEEAEMIGRWMSAFSEDTLPKAEHLTEESGIKKAQTLIAANRVAVWAVGGNPVAIATVGGTNEVARIGSVYTPPEHRGHGYASAVVAHISQTQLDHGKKMCCLYADARNPVSNSIYRKIGYEFVGRSSLYVMDKNQPQAAAVTAS
jgi:uncharacterized protein